jgi:hypothetical protein
MAAALVVVERGWHLSAPDDRRVVDSPANLPIRTFEVKLALWRSESDLQ